MARSWLADHTASGQRISETPNFGSAQRAPAGTTPTSVRPTSVFTQRASSGGGFDPDRFQQFISEIQAARLNPTVEQRRTAYAASRMGAPSSPGSSGSRTGTPSEQAQARAAALEGDDKFIGSIFRSAGNLVNRIPVIGDVAETAWNVVDDPLMAAMPWIDKPGSLIRAHAFEMYDAVPGAPGADGSYDIMSLWTGVRDNRGTGEMLYDRGVDNVWARRAGGLTGDVVTDPFTWLTMGSAAGARGAGQLVGRSMRIAEQFPKGSAQFNRLTEIAQKAHRYGGTRLSADDVATVRQLDMADNIAAGFADDVTIRTVLDDLAQGGTRFGELAGQYSTPTYLKGGTRLNVPFTGRITQRATNRLTGNRGAGTNQAVTFPILPQSLSKFTPRGGYQATRSVISKATDRNILGLGKVRDVLGGDKNAMRQMIRTGTPDEVFNAWHAFHAAVEGGTRSKAFSNDQLRFGVQMLEKIGRKNEVHIFDALGGKQPAIDALGPENYATVVAWRDQYRDAANKAVAATDDSPFIREMSTWTPTKLSDELQKVLNEAGENLTPELAELRKTADPKHRAAKIAPGREYFGRKIHATNDLKNNENGLTPREQADVILTDVLQRNGVDFHGKVFSDNFTDSLISNIVHTSGQIGDVYTVNRLTRAGVAVDLKDMASSDRAGVNQARIAVDAARERLSRSQGAKAAWAADARKKAEKLRNQASKLGQEKATKALPVAKAERWKNAVDKLVTKADDLVKRTAQETDEMLADLTSGKIQTVEQLDARLKRLDKSRGKLANEMNRLTTRRNKLLTEINQIHEQIDKAPGRARGQVVSSGKQIEVKRKELARVHQQEAAIREVAKVNYGELDRQRALIGATQERIDVLTAERRALPTRGTGERTVAARAAARPLDDEIVALRKHQAAAHEFIEAFDAVVADLPGGLATGTYFRDMAKHADSIERLEKMLGMEPGSITPVMANQMYRDLIDNPQSALRAQLEEASQALGDDAIRLQDDIDALVAEANVPEGLVTPDGDVILTNRRNPENMWAHQKETATGPVLTQKTTDRPLLEGDARYDPKTGRIKPEARRFQVEAKNPKTFYGGEAAANVDMLEQAFRGLPDANGVYKGGIVPNSSWGEGWQQWAEIAQKVKDGRRLHTTMREVMPVTGWDYQKQVQLLLESDVLSGHQKRRLREVWRDHLNAEGFDSYAWVDPGGNWSVAPLSRNQLKGHLQDMPDGAAQTITQHADRLVEEMDNTATAKASVAKQLGGDIEELNGRIDNMEFHRRDLEDLITDVSEEFDEAYAARQTERASLLDDRIRGYERALELQEAADSHLEQMRQLAAEGADEIDIQIQANMAEVARLESLAKKIEANRIGRSKKATPVEKSINKRINKQIDVDKKAEALARKEMDRAVAFQKKLETMSEKEWSTLLGSAWKQVGWNSDRAIPRNIAEALDARTKLQNKSSFIKKYDEALKTWRAMATTTPGFHFRNFLGGVINNSHADMNPAMYPLWRKMERTLEVHTHGGGNVRRRIPGQAGPISDPEAALEIAAQTMKAKGTFTLPDGTKVQGLGMNPKAVDAFIAVKRSGVAEGGQFDELGMNHLRAQHGSLNPFASEKMFGKATPESGSLTLRGRSTTNPFKSSFAPYRGSRNLGGSVENNLRGPLALDTMMKGGNIDSAIDTVHKFHFDYADLSNFERNVAHRSMAFYTWSRKNLPLQIEMMFENPKVFNQYQHLQRNLEIGQEEQDAMASWVDKATALRLPWGGGDTYLTPDVPFRDMTQMLNPTGILSGSAPPIKLAFEHFTGKSTFTGAPFEGQYRALGPGLGWMYGPLEAAGKATTTEEGTRVVNAGTFAMLTGALPSLSAAGRLMPAIRDDDSDEPNFGRRTREQQGSSLISYLFGIGSYVATPSEKRIAMQQPAFTLQREAKKLKTLGRDEEAQELYDMARTIFEDVDAAYPRPGG